MSTFLILVTVASLAAATVCGAIAWRAITEERARSAARVAALANAIRGGHEERPLFANEHATGRTAPIALAAGATVAVALVVFAIAQVHSSPKPVAAPLELVSMRHARDGASLTVMGVVRNPTDGVPVSRVSAVVSAFSKNGAPITSNRAPIDFLTLDPGDESNFAVTLINGNEVGRYRVTFRTERGVIRHVDRRGDPVTLAVENSSGGTHAR